jgi:hypothetical protein
MPSLTLTPHPRSDTAPTVKRPPAAGRSQASKDRPSTRGH